MKKSVSQKRADGKTHKVQKHFLQTLRLKRQSENTDQRDQADNGHTDERIQDRHQKLLRPPALFEKKLADNAPGIERGP